MINPKLRYHRIVGSTKVEFYFKSDSGTLGQFHIDFKHQVTDSQLKITLQDLEDIEEHYNRKCNSLPLKMGVFELITPEEHDKLSKEQEQENVRQ